MIAQLKMLSGCAALALAAAVWAAGDTKPALPAGHPEIPGAAATRPALPAGHPEVGGAKGGMPAGHPPVAGDNKLPAGHPPVAGDNKLPAGHPPMESLRGAATQPIAAGSVKIQAVQGTKGAAAIGAMPITVEFYGQGSRLLKTLEAKLDAKGQATVEAPADICQPVVRVEYAGIPYEALGEVLDRNQRTTAVEMVLHEATAEAPAWTVAMQHVLVRAVPEGLQVMEMLSINNPADRTWTGAKENETAHPHTIALTLTPGAKEVMGPGMPEGSLHLHGSKLLSTLPLLPGRTELQIEYTVPAKDGKVELVITAPAAVGQLYVFVPDDSSEVVPTGLDAMGKRQTGEGSKRGFRATELKAGQQVKLAFAGLKAATPPKAAVSTRLPHIVAGVGGGIVLLGGVTYLLVKSPRKGA